MSSHDQSPDPGSSTHGSDRTPTGREPVDTADTANFQEFMDSRADVPADDGRTFRLVSLLVGIVVLVIIMYLLLF